MTVQQRLCALLHHPVMAGAWHPGVPLDEEHRVMEFRCACELYVLTFACWSPYQGHG